MKKGQSVFLLRFAKYHIYKLFVFKNCVKNVCITFALHHSTGKINVKIRIPK